MPVTIEFKARCKDLQKMEDLLQQYQPLYIGEDHQIDTYYHVPYGRLKLREGTIENALIHYVRSNAPTAKQSDVLLYQHRPDKTLKQILQTALDIKVVVDKHRRIYFVDNVKFHFDTVAALGTFIEVEAIGKEGVVDLDTLREQCYFYAAHFKIQPDDYVALSYSDLLLQQQL